MIYFQLGSIALLPGETECLGFVKRIVYSDRGEPIHETRTLQIVIDQIATGVGLNAARMRQLEAITNIDRCGFADESVGQLPIWLNASESLSGIRIINPISWTPRSEVEFATHLTMYMSFEADYPLRGNPSEIMEYEETLTFEDDGPQKVTAIETDTGNFETFVVSQKPKRYLIQQGFAAARSTYPLRNDPLIRLGTIIKRSLSRGTPIRNGNQLLGYRVAWRYVFLVKDAEEWFPRLR